MKHVDWVAVVVMIIFIATLLVPAIGEAIQANTMPRCQEDQVIVGHGQFNNGHWEYYTCGPALDDCGTLSQ